jgi:hypothetical protein
LNDFTSGFNITTHITHYEDFEGICGIYDSEISNALDRMIPQEPLLKTQLMKTMKDNYNGYMFTPTQSTPIFNTTLVVYFLREFARLKRMPRKLIDTNVQPSESGLEIISKSPLSQRVIDELYEKEQEGIYIPYDISDTISTRDMMNLLQTNSLYILSFLYYLGALTQTFLPKGKEIGTVFKIPNQVIKSVFLDNIKQRLLVDERIQIDLIQAVNELIEERNIESICKVIQKHFLSHLKGNEIVFSLENSVKMSFLLGFTLSGRKMKVEVEYKEKEERGSKWADLVIPQEKIHLEFKNIKVGEIVLKDGRSYNPDVNSWDEGVAYAHEIGKLSDGEVMKLKLKYPKAKGEKGNNLDREMETIGDVWESALKQTKENQAWISRKIGGRMDSFCVLRIGLYRLKYAKV